MSLSFDDKDSFMEAAGSLHFNNPPSDPYTLQPVGNSSSRLPAGLSPHWQEWSEEFEDIGFDSDPSGSNLNDPGPGPNTLQFRRSTSSSISPRPPGLGEDSE